MDEEAERSRRKQHRDDLVRKEDAREARFAIQEKISAAVRHYARKHMSDDSVPISIPPESWVDGPSTAQEGRVFPPFDRQVASAGRLKRGAKGYSLVDLPLAEEINRRVAAGEVQEKVALALAETAIGGGTLESKAERLTKMARNLRSKA